jgi:retron-type reverse transcriptase
MQRVATAIVQEKTLVIALDLRAYFDTVRHHLLLDKVARRINDRDVMHLLKLMLTAPLHARSSWDDSHTTPAGNLPRRATL